MKINYHYQFNKDEIRWEIIVTFEKNGKSYYSAHYLNEKFSQEEMLSGLGKIFRALEEKIND